MLYGKQKSCLVKLMPDGQRIEFQVKISQLGPESDFSFCAAGGAFRIAARACEQLNAAGLGRNRRAIGDYWRVLPVLAREEPRLFFSFRRQRA